MNNNYIDTTTIETSKKRTADYFFWQTLAILIFPFGLFFGVGIVIALLYFFIFGRAFTLRQARARKYFANKTTLHVHEGVYFLKQKSIPLDRITDFVLHQGPIMRFFNIWAINVQTAGSMQSEAILYGIDNPDQTHELLIKMRNDASKLSHPS